MRNFANKYRPSKFEDVIGQENIVTILKKQVEDGNIKNGYLFTGPAGTGKTTMARIMARELNGDIGSGTIEIDAASNTGVDNIRDIIENAKFKSIDTKYKIYIIDEVHMLSTGAFNALLKILEEPPTHVVFIACTTDPQKIPATIMSRLQRFNFNRVSKESLCDRLNYIADREGLTVEPKAVEYIVQISNGGVRDAISTLDLCSSIGNEITLENVLNILGKVGSDVYMEFVDGVINDKQKALNLLNTMWGEGVNVKQFIHELLEYLIDLQVYGITKDKSRLPVGASEGDAENLIGSNLTAVIKSLLDLNYVIKYDNNPKYIVEGWVLTNDWAK